MEQNVEYKNARLRVKRKRSIDNHWSVFHDIPLIWVDILAKIPWSRLLPEIARYLWITDLSIAHGGRTGFYILWNSETYNESIKNNQ